MEKSADFVSYRLSDIGWQIRVNRSKFNMSQEDLAFRLGVTQKTISDWEHENVYPNLKNFIQMCNLFGEDFYNSCILCRKVYRL